MTKRLITIATAAAGAMLWPASIGPTSASHASATTSATSADSAFSVAQGPVMRRSARTCQGKRATHVGRKGRVLRGTNGRDVIVTNGASSVMAGAGHDLICVTGGRQIQVDAGNGNDEVVVKQRRGRVTAFLGRGADTYLGNRVSDRVYASDGFDDDRHKDVIRTRGGDDFVATGKTGTANADVVHLGSGDDLLWTYSFDNRRAELRAGGGHDSFYFRREGGRVDEAAEWVIDNRKGRITDRGRVKARKVRGFEFFGLTGLPGASQHFIGSGADETIELNPDATVSAHMGGGDDTVMVWYDGLLDISAKGIAGGAGRDEIGLREMRTSLVGDLSTQVVSVATDSTPHTIAFRSFEDMFLTSLDSVTITGDDGPNRLTGISCNTTIDGAGGDDLLSSDGFLEDTGCAKPATLRGGEGNDELIGGPYDDHLDGGPGTDSADGRRGTDTCVAERTINCEG